MLTDHVERYIALRQALGFKLRSISGRLHAFARFATARGDSHVRASTVVDWGGASPSPGARHVRLRDAVHLARFLHAEDPAHEVPPPNLFHAPATRSPSLYLHARGSSCGSSRRPVVCVLSKPYPLRRPDVRDAARPHRRDRTARLGGAQPLEWATSCPTAS